MVDSPTVLNAGQRLLAAQRRQRTNLCVGVDAHYDPKAGLDVAFYQRYAGTILTDQLAAVIPLLVDAGMCDLELSNAHDVAKTTAGVIGYFRRVIGIAWAEGIRVFKPQIAFYEQFNPFGLMALHAICRHIHKLAQQDGSEYFIILDAKRGDIDTTQTPYFASYLTDVSQSVVGNITGQYGFDTMTITTWMGEDVILPGMDWFKQGKGAIIVTRSSNPGGTTLQDAEIHCNMTVRLSDKQEKYRLQPDELSTVMSTVNRPATVADAMFYITERVSDTYKLTRNGVSPLFSVVGSTVIEDGSFRKLRPTGIALVPGFGAQGGSFANAMPLLARDGVMAGQGAVFSSSRGHNYPWMEKLGGSGNPDSLPADLISAIASFRQAEKKAYLEADMICPYE